MISPHADGYIYLCCERALSGEGYLGNIIYLTIHLLIN